MSLKEDFREWRDHKKKARQKMVGCPWANFDHKTWLGEVCIICDLPVDKEGYRDLEALKNAK